MRQQNNTLINKKYTSVFLFYPMSNSINCLYLDSFVIVCLRVSARDYDVVDYFTYIYALFIQHHLTLIAIITLLL